MKKIKSNLELLKKLKLYRNKFDPSIGLCSIVKWCKEEGTITSEEYKKIMKLLKVNKPKEIYSAEYWFHFDGIERGKFLNKLIKKYNRKSLLIKKI